MHTVTSATLTRDCEATRIPSGNALILPAGTQVDITQNLGGTYTIHATGGLFRIAGKDADALGIEPEAVTSGNLQAPGAPPVTGLIDEKLVWDTLKTCYDPEIPVNIVDLGLIY